MLAPGSPMFKSAEDSQEELLPREALATRRSRTCWAEAGLHNAAGREAGTSR